MKSFYKDNTKLSIGMEGESGYYADGMCVSDRYDYDNEYMGDGVFIFGYEKKLRQRSMYLVLHGLKNVTTEKRRADMVWSGSNIILTRKKDNRCYGKTI